MVLTKIVLGYILYYMAYVFRGFSKWYYIKDVTNKITDTQLQNYP